MSSSFRALCLATLCLGGLASVPATTALASPADDSSSREQQQRDLQRQIDELREKLEENRSQQERLQRRLDSEHLGSSEQQQITQRSHSLKVAEQEMQLEMESLAEQLQSLGNAANQATNNLLRRSLNLVKANPFVSTVVVTGITGTVIVVDNNNDDDDGGEPISP